MSQFNLLGDGVTRRFTVPFATSSITQLPAGCTISGDNELLFSVAPAYGAVVTISFQLPTTSGGGGSGGGLTEAQYDNLVQDSELSAVEQNLLSNSGATSGEVRLFVTTNGQAPAGNTRVSGVFAPAGLYGQQRFMLTNFSAPIASSENKVWTLSSTAGASRYGDIGTGVNTTIANWPGNASSGIWCALATDDHAYTFGGSGTATVTSATYRYTVASNSWTQVANMPAARNSSLGAIQADGRMLVIGGLSVGNINLANYTDTVYRYDPVANSWATVAPLPFKSYQGYAVRLADGRIFCLFSNTTTDGTTSGGNRAVIYTPGTNSWETVDTPPYAGPCYQDGNGNVVMLSLVTPGNAQTFNFSAAVGSRWSSTPYTAPTSVSSFTGPAAFTNPMANGTVFPMQLVNSVFTGQALFTIGALTQAAGNAFYAVKD